jgi:hypothetical protein
VFDTVEHSILLQWLKHRFGITDKAHTWIRTYLSNRKQSILIDNVHSKELVVNFNLPQGSVLGPRFFKDYESPVGKIIRSFGLQAHFYADDTQLYIAFAPDDKEDVCIQNVEACVSEIRQWMAANYLKLNDDKTEFIVLGSRHSLSKVSSSSVQIGEICVNASSSVRNIGAVFDTQMKMNMQVTAVCKSAWFQIHQIGKIRKYLTSDQTKSIVHAFVISKLDNNNSLLLGVPDSTIAKLQRIQNAAAKLIYRAKKYDHVTGLLKDLHWLPVKHRIHFKVLLLTFKALHGQGPQYLLDLLAWYTPQRTLRSSRNLLLHVPQTHLKTYGDRAFEAAAPKLWNALPLHVRESNSVLCFKQNLKTHLFKLAYKC